MGVSPAFILAVYSSDVLNLINMENTMTIDRYTKSVLTVIALGLLLNGLNPWIAPPKAYAEISSADLITIQGYLLSRESDLSGIAGGLCLNSKLC